MVKKGSTASVSLKAFEPVRLPKAGSPCVRAAVHPSGSCRACRLRCLRRCDARTAHFHSEPFNPLSFGSLQPS